MESAHKQKKQKLANLKDEAAKGKVGKEESVNPGTHSQEKRTTNLALLEDLKRINAELTAQLQEVQVWVTPSKLRMIHNFCKTCKRTSETTQMQVAFPMLNSANRWTDNIYNVKSFCEKKFNVLPQDFDKSFLGGKELEYVEDE